MTVTTPSSQVKQRRSNSKATPGTSKSSGRPRGNANNNNNNSNNEGALVRPTEAQLRWAQFHHKRRAIGVRENIQAFHQLPTNLEQVRGALPEDGATSSSGGSDTIRTIRQQRPKVSRGRRALLKVSRRAYERRRLAIQQHGYQGMIVRVSAIGVNDSDEDVNADGDDEGKQKFKSTGDQHEDALNEIFMVKSSRKRGKKQGRRRRLQGRKGATNKDESFKRFQAACHAMMMNLAAPPKQAIILPSKIWTRTVDPASALDDEYLDPKWGIRRRIGGGPSLTAAGVTGDNNFSRSFTPLDRGASWMMHLPKATSSARENPYYHDPSLAPVPSTPGSTAGSESQFSVASTLALQAPGAQKFNQLVALVQQRMIEKRQEVAVMEERRKSSGPTPKMKLRHDLGQSSSDAEGDEHHEGYVDEDRGHYVDAAIDDMTFRSPGALPFSPQSTHILRARQSRKKHFVPRMHLKDFMPPGASLPDAYQDNGLDEIGDSSDGPTKMKLRDYPPGQAPKEERRRSRAQELAESFEPKEDPKDRRLSRTQQMAQALEPQPKHPKMKIRESVEFEHTGDEKKMSEDIPSPRRLSEAQSEPYLASNDDGDEISAQPPRHSDPSSRSTNVQRIREQLAASTVQQTIGTPDKPIGRLSHTASSMQQSPSQLESIGEDNRLIVEPPRRKPHPLSGQFMEAMHSSQNPPAKPQILVQPLPPGACCARCDKMSPREGGQHTARLSAASGQNTKSRPAPSEVKPPRESVDFFSQVRQLNASKASTRVSDFFGQLRQTAAQELKGGPPRSPSRDSVVTSASNRMSDFFSRVRTMNLGEKNDEKTQQTVTNVQPTEPVEDSDFFAQVREMMSQDDDDEETTMKRVSDFFAQVRQLSQDDNEASHSENPTAEDVETLLCEDCQVDDIQHRMESASVTVSPVHSTPGTQSSHGGAATPRDSRVTATSAASGCEAQSASVPLQTGDPSRSEHSAFSEVEGASRGNELRTMSAEEEEQQQGHQQQEKSKDHPGKLGGKGSSGMPGRVGGFLQMLQGKKEEEARTLQEVKEMRLNLEVQGGEQPGNTTAPTQQTLEYDSDNDLLAMAAYRKSQESRKLSVPPDDTSSISSFRPLPDAFREVVKKIGSSPSRMSAGASGRPDPEEEKVDQSRPLQIDNSFSGQEPDGRPQTLASTGERITQTDTTDQSLTQQATSPSRLSLTSSALERLSPEKYKEVHGRVMASSPLMGRRGQEIIDTDGTTSDASYSGMDPSILANLMLSPDLLQKRLHQAINSVEAKQWEQVKYLLKANPWLAEMCELTSNQYLLHKLAFFGASAPLDLCKQLIDMFPAAVHKFDQDGNVPLHLAAAAGHLKMINILGEKFKSGASIRNEDGMLPLHFTIASYGGHSGKYDDEKDNEGNPSPLLVVKTVLHFFPTAVAITDNDGNLPIHVAVECLLGGLGVDVIYMLMDEAERQMQDPYGARFRNKVKLEDIVNDDISAVTFPTEKEFEVDMNMDEEIHCNVVKNEFGETPLLSAIRGHRGWEIVEALASGPAGSKAALLEDANKNNALHLLLDEYQDPAAAMSILRSAPDTVTQRNNAGMLPIEVACLQLMPEEVILAIALIDLPFNIDDKETVQFREGNGGSWWFLACECDDSYADIVQEIVVICSFQQIRALCFFHGGTNQGTVMDRATPKCHDILTHALRFLGRFEFVGDSAIEADPTIGLKTFEALDFNDSFGKEDGRKVVLKCYSKAETFKKVVTSIDAARLDPVYIEEVQVFGDLPNEEKTDDSHVEQQYCISIEAPQLTLDRVVDGMVRKGGYSGNEELQRKFAAKMCAVLRLIAKAVRHLHNAGLIHGNLCTSSCGKFDHAWKLLGRLGVQRIGAPMDPSRFYQSFPPESLQLDEAASGVYDSDNPSLSFKPLIATPAVDIWAFGKLAYETLVGRPLVDFDPAKKTFEDGVPLLEIMEWAEPNMQNVFTDLLNSGVTESCAELVTSCLFPSPDNRPPSMAEILDDPFWKDMRQFRQRSSPSKRRGDGGSSVYTETSPKSIFTETASAVDTSQEVETAEI